MVHHLTFIISSYLMCKSCLLGLKQAYVDLYGCVGSMDFCAEQRIADISYFLRTGMSGKITKLFKSD